MRGGQIGLDLGIVDDPTLLEIDQQHLARLQTPFLDDFFFRNGQHAHFGGHHHLIVIGDQITGRTQAVAVQGGSDLPAIGKAHRGRTVPGLHQGGVIFVESAALLIHQGIAGPGLGNHHHHRMGQRIAALDQQFESVVETGGVGLAVEGQWPQFGQIVAQEFGLHGIAARHHPVQIALQRVDFSVMANHPEGMSEAPGREGVGGKALMHQGERRGQARISKIVVIGPDLLGQQHSLVDDGPRRQRGNIKSSWP